jgi:hypothetical protein
LPFSEIAERLRERPGKRPLAVSTDQCLLRI